MKGKRFSRALVLRYAAKQGHSCLYCHLPFGTVVDRPHGRSRIQVPEGDHFVPQAWRLMNTSGNLVVACDLCNSIKGSSLFDSFETAWRFIAKRRVDKGLVVVFIPMVPLTQNAEEWASEYARWLATA